MYIYPLYVESQRDNIDFGLGQAETTFSCGSRQGRNMWTCLGHPLRTPI